MPYCSECGSQVGDRDAYCAKCGARQPVPARAASPFSSISPKAASVLCYIPWIGWIPAIIVLASERFKRDHTVRFHGFQGLYLFVTWLVLDWAIEPTFHMIPHQAIDFPAGAILKLFLFGVWIYMLVKTSQNETVRLPLLGELADRSLAEQR